MKRLTFKALLLSLVVAISVGCNSDEDNNSSNGSSGIDPLVQQGKVKEAAELSAKVAELALGNEGYQEIKGINQLLDRALELDPSNERAHFYKAMIAPYMATEGLVKQVEKQVETYPDFPEVKAGYDEMVKDLMASEMPAVSAFYLNMPETEQYFENFEDQRLWVKRKLIPALQSMIDHLSKVSDEGLAKIISSKRFDAIFTSDYKYEYHWQYCHSYYSNGEYQYNCNNYDFTYESKPEARSTKVDEFDRMMIIGGIRAYINGLKVGTAYSFAQVEDLGRELGRYLDDNDNIVYAEAKRIVDKYPEFMKLDPSHELGSVHNDLLEAAQDLIRLQTLQDKLCGNEERKKNVVENICIALSSSQAELVAESLVVQQEIGVGYDKKGNIVKTTIDLQDFISNPAGDLRDLLPSELNTDGTVKSFKDPTLGGLLPKGDAVSLSNTVKKAELILPAKWQ